MVESSTKKYKIAILGATGAIGKEIMRHVKKDARIAEVALLVRSKLDEWNQEEYDPKLKFIERPTFDDITDLKGELDGYDAFICTIGTRVKVGEE